MGTYEDDNFVDTIHKLGWEVALDCAHDELLRVWLDGTVSHVVQEGSAEVAGHDDDSVAEVYDATLAIGQAAVVEDLQEELDELPRSLLNLIDEDNRVRLAADVLSELATLVVADITGRCADETRDRMFLGVF